MSETAIAFARLCLCGVETVVAFVGAGRAVTETGGAFAAEKWAFWVRFSAAEVMVVSMVAVQGRAVVMVVSCWPASVAAEVLLVSMAAVWGRAVVMVVSQLSRGCVPSAK